MARLTELTEDRIDGILHLIRTASPEERERIAAALKQSIAKTGVSALELSEGFQRLGEAFSKLR